MIVSCFADIVHVVLQVQFEIMYFFLNSYILCNLLVFFAD